MSEAPTVEGRLADMIEQARYVELGGNVGLNSADRVLLSTKDCAVNEGTRG